MYEKLEECPICKFTNQENYLICNDHSVTKESFALVKCPKCTLVYTTPRPTANQIGRYYQSDNYISHSNKANNLLNFVYKIARTYSLHWKLGLIRKFCQFQCGTILDYGSGTGDFLNYMSQKGWQAQGVEPNQQAASKAVDKGIVVHPTLNEQNKELFDLITAWHVIEHVHELRGTIRKLRKRLKPEGKMLIAVPNYKSFDCEYYKEYWAAYDVPRHLYHFSQESVAQLAQNTKLKIIATVGMPLDAFYVSMLSEKYKGSKNHILDGIIQGYRSNQSASKTKEYSSLIYVLSK